MRRRAGLGPLMAGKIRSRTVPPPPTRHDPQRPLVNDSFGEGKDDRLHKSLAFA